MSNDEKNFSIELGPELDDSATQRWGEYEEGDLPDDVEPMKSNPLRHNRTGARRAEKLDARRPDAPPTHEKYFK